MSRVHALLLAAGLVSSCASPAPRVFYVNSYHPGYPSSDEISAAIRETLGHAGVAVEAVYLDAKRHPAGLEPSDALVSEFEDWKREFVVAQRDADVVYVVTNGGIRTWDEAAAVAWVRQTISKPVVTCDDFMMSYAVFGLTKVAREQGEWAAQTALAILGGTKPGDIPVVSNRQTRCYFNADLAARVGFPEPSGRQCAAWRLHFVD